MISAPSKSGTTWTQTLVGLLLFEGGPWPGTVAELSPWLDGVPVRDDVTDVCVGRDPRDAVVSTTHHLANLDHDRAAELSGLLRGDLETMPVPHGGFPPDVFLRGWIEEGADAPWPLPDLLHHHVSPGICGPGPTWSCSTSPTPHAT